MPDFRALIRNRIGPLGVDPARENDILDELAHHAAQHYADLTAQGLDEQEAIAAALAPLADAGAFAVAVHGADRKRPMTPVPPMSGTPLAGLPSDVRYACRILRRTPAFTAAVVVTLALGIGASTAIFSIVHAVLLRPLPYAAPERLVAVGMSRPDGSVGNAGYATIVDWKERSHAFEDIAIVRTWTPTLMVRNEPERIPAMRVSANFFRMLGVEPSVGRNFDPAADTPEGWRVIILSDRLWRRRFNADPAVIGHVVTMNGAPYTIVGVMPSTFEPLISERYYQRADMWALLGYDRAQPDACRTCQHLKAFARVKPHVDVAAAAADLNAVQSTLQREFPREYALQSTTVVPLETELTRRVRPVLNVLVVAVAFVLLIACANVANLLLARMAARERELALRLAIGAARVHVVRQLLVESTLLACMAGVTGVALTATFVPLVTRLAPASIERLDSTRIDVAVLGFALALSLLTAFLFGLLPALRASRTDLHSSMHDAGRTTRRKGLLGRVLVGADVALSVVLLVCAGLMIRTVERLIGVDPGFDASGVLTLQTSLLGPAYANDDTIVQTTDRIVVRLAALPGVTAAAAASQIPLGGSGDEWGVHPEGRPPGPNDPSAERFGVTPAYFAVMHIALRRGRLFTATDTAGAELVIIVNEYMARTLWPGRDPIDGHVRIGGSDGPWRRVVGVVADVRHNDMALPPAMEMYVPAAQAADSFLTLVVRANRDPDALATEARQAIWSVANDLPVYNVARLTELVDRSIAPRRFVMILLEAFAGVAVLMTAVGIYAVVSYSVAERTREIGIRTALGASASDIVRVVTTSAMSAVAVGLAVGVALSAAVTQLLRTSLYAVSATDPATFLSVMALLAAVGLIAQVVPIGRALQIEPTVALRAE